MQVGTGGPTGHSGSADALPLGYGVAGVHCGAVEMAVHADQAVAVIDKHRLAVEEIVIDGEHLAMRTRLDRSPARDGNIESGMR